MKRIALAALVAGGFVALPPSLPSSFSPLVTEARADEAKIFHGKGVVTGVDADTGVLTLDDEAIPGLMDAMEMEYQTNPPSLAKGLTKGDKVEFSVDGKSLTVVGIRKTAKP